ncbi:hypothetical protein LINPERPRIM_LOCUS8172 [Linum perenne]
MKDLDNRHWGVICNWEAREPFSSALAEVFSHTAAYIIWSSGISRYMSSVRVLSMKNHDELGFKCLLPKTRNGMAFAIAEGFEPVGYRISSIQRGAAEGQEALFSLSAESYGGVAELLMLDNRVETTQKVVIISVWR